MRLSIQHRTTYFYSLPARASINELRLAPEENLRQTPGELRLTILPAAEISESRDLHGNLVHSFEVEEEHLSLEILAESEVTTEEVSPSALERARGFLLPKRPKTRDEFAYQFLSESGLVRKDPKIWREAVDIRKRCDNSWADVIEGLSNHIFDTCTWMEPTIHQMTTASDVRRTRKGTCQDFSHLLIGYCRALKIPARYISGYLHDPGLDAGIAPETVGAETSHAWVEAHVPDVGWIGIDPTNRCWINQHYVSLASGRDYREVAPVRGSLIGGGKERSLKVEVSVRRVA